MDIICQILLTFLLWLRLHTDIFVTIGLFTDQNCAACVNTVFEMVIDLWYEICPLTKLVNFSAFTQAPQF